MSDKQQNLPPLPEEDAVSNESNDWIAPALSAEPPPEEEAQEYKRTYSIGVFFVCLLFGFLFAMQFKSVDITSENAVNNQLLRTQELQNMLNEERQKNDALYQELLTLKDDIARYRELSLQSGDYAAVLNNELRRAELVAGFTDVIGPGVTVTMSDSVASVAGDGLTVDPSYLIIHDNDILQVVNELRDAGAEAISINGERLLATSEIRCAGSIVSVNNNRYAAPFVIRAIGDPEALESALKMRGGVIEQLAFFQIEVDVQKSDEVLIRAYTGTTSYTYAQEYKDDVPANPS
ncbi:MAG: DUF881 domain-containing protein [Clostridia bacterium]|nr:DUF881 domain-containing protein [Clostridia bacterium]